MGDNEKLSGRVGLDTTDFKTNISGMNREMRVLESGFRAAAAGLGDWANDASGLEMRIKSLTGQIDVQERKVAATRAEYERIAAEKGATSRAAQDLEIKLNKETETLGKMQAELADDTSALTDLQAGSENAGKGVQDLGDKAQATEKDASGLKSTLSGLWDVVKAGAAVMMATVGAIVAIGAAVGGLVFSSASAGGALADMSAQTGISTTRLQELSYIGDQVGTSLDTITGANAKLIRSMASAQYGLGTQAQAFRELKIKVTDANGDLRDSQTVFAEALDALNKIQNPAERDALAMQIFGKSAQELNPLIKAGSGELAALAEQAHKVGAVMSEDTVNGLEAFDDTLASLKAGLKGTLGTLAAAFLPAFQGIFGQLGGYLEQFSAIVSGSGGDLGKIADGLSGLVGKIVGDIASQAPALLQAGANILQSILSGVMQNLPTILTAVIALLQSLFTFLVQALPMLMQAGVQLLLALLNGIIQALPMLIEAAFQMIITLVQGIAAALPTLIPAIVEMLVMIINTIIQNLPLLLQAALQLIMGLVQGIMNALPILIQAVPQILQTIIDTLMQMLPVLVEMAPEIIVALITGIMSALPSLGAAIPQIISTIIDAIITLLPAILDAGWQILQGIWKGIQSNLPWFWAKIKEFALGIWESIKEALGISSPSKLFADTIGPQIPAGIWKGMENAMPTLRQQLAGAMGSLAADMNFVVGGGLGGPGQMAPAYAGNTYQYINNVNNAGVDAAELDRLQRRQEILYGNR